GYGAWSGWKLVENARRGSIILRHPGGVLCTVIVQDPRGSGSGDGNRGASFSVGRVPAACYKRPDGVGTGQQHPLPYAVVESVIRGLQCCRALRHLTTRKQRQDVL